MNSVVASEKTATTGGLAKVRSLSTWGGRVCPTSFFTEWDEIK